MLKKILILMVFMVLSSCNEVYAQKVEVDLEDLKQFRIAVVERDSLKKELELEKTQKIAYQNSSANWQGLYNQEKNRADNIITKAVAECDASKDFLTKANRELHTQHDEDKKRVADLEFENKKLRSQLKYYFMGGAVVGGAVTYTASRKFSF